MLDDLFVNTIIIPKCPYCKARMFQNHSTIWTGKSYKTISLEFMCNGGYYDFPPHHIKIKARTIEEWKNHISNLEF